MTHSLNSLTRSTFLLTRKLLACFTFVHSLVALVRWRWCALALGQVIVDDFHLRGARQALFELQLEHPNIILLPIPEDYVGACRQLGKGHWSAPLHTRPYKPQQGAYWAKAGRVN